MANFYDIVGVRIIRHKDPQDNEVEFGGKRIGQSVLRRSLWEHCKRRFGTFTGTFYDRYIRNRADLVRRYITMYGYTQAETGTLIADLLNALRRDGVLTEASYSRLAEDAEDGADKLQEELAGLWLDAMWQRKEDWE